MEQQLVKLHHLKVTVPNGHGGKGAVELDGEQLKKVVGIALSMRVGELNTATLELLAPEIEVEGKFQVMLPEETQATLKRLGWTPPG